MLSELDISMSDYNSKYLSMVASKYGGDATINEIRVMNRIFRAQLTMENIGVSGVAESLGIPKSTVSRAVLKLCSSGWVCEDHSEIDGRRRYLRLTSKLLDRFAVEKQILMDRWSTAA